MTLPEIYSFIINASSTEAPFLHALLTEASHITHDIVVSCGDYLYNGTAEDMSYIILLKSQFPHVKFVTYHVDFNVSKDEMTGVVTRPNAYWHNLARWTAIQNIDPMSEWVFVIDADEIPEAQKLKEWLETTHIPQLINTAYKMACYWYFKDPCYQSKTLEDSILLIHRKHLNQGTLFNDYERDDILRVSGVQVQRQVLAPWDGTPMFHHFSWVRTRQGLYQKVSSWAHVNDIFKNVNPQELVNYIFHDDNVNDVVHKYQYVKVPNIFNIDISNIIKVQNGGSICAE